MIFEKFFKKYNDITLLTCNFNNEKLTMTMLESFNKYVKNFKNIIILDNSTTNPIQILNKKYTVIDNTNFKLTPDFKQVSKNHCCSIDYAFKNLIKTKYVLLCDNDIIFNKHIVNLLNKRKNFDCIGEIGYDTVPPERIFPYLMICDLDKVKKKVVDYFDESRIIKKQEETCEILSSKYGNVYDTGYSFYRDIVNTFVIKRIRIEDYCIHLKAGSLKNEQEITDFINKNL